MTNLPSVPPAPTEMRVAMQAALDANHLQLLEIGFYISGALTAFRFLWFLMMVGFFCTMGFVVSKLPQHSLQGANHPPPALFFFMFAAIFGFIIILALIFAALEIYAGRCLKQRRHPLLIQIVAGIYCLSIPWGTALGVCTFMVLNRPSVRALFT